ncbi:hypothetical protein SAICODRAFT_31177 [Saitoella complicata NRRL Y-17804]|uniref:uncharacterized protein n=1 Tax=Saitoella complicata (strain BCRC 22490 / CBS 7301 / JCM 7358 / NBRC 10748 / NRRL Y-17804) TaxID=698492 RepID=UPI000867155C|nr:uncharacterized protein SAICODRAFT_31177 [Saitoella complicata NRRL Y-17804]ODQ51498.1 hypothetical protein SAICODRAFT_31177 [Saitoella complicata NRRL Y-17804]
MAHSHSQQSLSLIACVSHPMMSASDVSIFPRYLKRMTSYGNGSSTIRFVSLRRIDCTLSRLRSVQFEKTRERLYSTDPGVRSLKRFCNRNRMVLLCVFTNPQLDPTLSEVFSLLCC